MALDLKKLAPLHGANLHSGSIEITFGGKTMLNLHLCGTSMQQLMIQVVDSREAQIFIISISNAPEHTKVVRLPYKK